MGRPVWVLIFLICAAGCGRGSFVGQRLDNFSAYYNTFYNAENALHTGIDAFDEGLESNPIDQDVYLSLFGRSEQASTRREPFEDAIKKSADILRKHPDSKWVDDAMLVIGKAWFFTLNFVGAEGKFLEILALDSPLHDEARFWLARTYIASGAYDEAFNHLQATLNGEDLSRRWEPIYRLALAELHVQRKSWEEAAIELEAGLEGLRERELGGRAQFLLGQVFEVLERYADAVAAYNSVDIHKPFYELSYAAQYSAVRVETDHGDPEAAMRALRRMERDDKNYDHRAELALLRGRVLQALEYYDDALDVYDELLYDPTASGGKVRGPTHYALGVFYRDVYSDFPYAGAHFDSAQSSMSSSRTPSSGVGARSRGASPLYAPGAITDGPEQASMFLSFSDVLDRIALMDSLLYLGTLDDSTFQAVILELRKRRAEEIEEMLRSRKRLKAESQFRRDGGQDVKEGFGRTPPGKDIGGGAAESDAGFLFHRDGIRLQQARADFILLWGERPLAPNWRRIAAINDVAVAEEGNYAVNTVGDDVMESGGLPAVDLSSIPRDSLSRAALLEDRAMAHYELANVLFLSMNRPDSAAAWYRMVIEESGDFSVAQRAYYALAEVQRALGDTLGAERLYRTIIERYPLSEFSGRAHERMGWEPASEIITDSLTLAEAAYDSAHAKWRGGAYASSLDDLVGLALNYPGADAAPRALLAAGTAYMEWAVRDSLDLLGVLPITIPDSALKAGGIFPTKPRARARGIGRPPLQPLDNGGGAIKTLQDTTVAAPARVDDEVGFRLETLLNGLTLLYPGAAQTPQARLILVALAERRAYADSLLMAAQMAADSLLALRADTLAADSLLALRADTLAADSLLALRADTLAADLLGVVGADTRAADSLGVVGLDTRAVDALGAVGLDPRAVDAPDGAPGAQALDLLALPGVEPPVGQQAAAVQPGLGVIDWSQGGYTIFIRAEKTHEAAVGFVTNFNRHLDGGSHPMDVFTAAVQEEVEFRIGIGLFATLQEAEALLRQLTGRIPRDARITHVPKQR